MLGTNKTGSGRNRGNANIGINGPTRLAVRSDTNSTVGKETHHPLFVDHFREYVEKRLGESFDGLNDILRSKYMSRYFAERVLAPRNPIIPTIEEDVQACVVDGSNDQVAVATWGESVALSWQISSANTDRASSA